MLSWRVMHCIVFVDSGGVISRYCLWSCVQSSHYVIVRRLREKLRSQIINPLRRAIKDGVRIDGRLCDTLQENVQDKLTQGMRQLTHVPGCAELWPSWFDTCFAFAKWWLAKVCLLFAYPAADDGDDDNDDDFLDIMQCVCVR